MFTTDSEVLEYPIVMWEDFIDFPTNPEWYGVVPISLDHTTIWGHLQ